MTKENTTFNTTSVKVRPQEDATTAHTLIPSITTATTSQSRNMSTTLLQPITAVQITASQAEIPKTEEQSKLSTSRPATSTAQAAFSTHPALNGTTATTQAEAMSTMSVTIRLTSNQILLTPTRITTPSTVTNSILTVTRSMPVAHITSLTAKMTNISTTSGKNVTLESKITATNTGLSTNTTSRTASSMATRTPSATSTTMLTTSANSTTAQTTATTKPTTTTSMPTTTTTATTVSKPTTATTTTTTIPTTTAIHLSPLVILEMIILVDFTTDLEDSQSSAFKNLANQVERDCDKVYKQKYGSLFIRVLVLAFSGVTKVRAVQYVRATVEILFNQNSTEPIPDNSNIVEALKDAVQTPSSGFSLSVDPPSIKVIRSMQIVAVTILTNGSFVSGLTNKSSNAFRSRASMIKTGLEPFFFEDFPMSFSILSLTNFSPAPVKSRILPTIQNSMDLAFASESNVPNNTQIVNTIVRAARDNTLPFQIYTYQIIVNNTVFSSAHLSSRINVFSASILIALALLFPRLC
ncbi:hypothetical protein DNTS_021722 [Danionella cerebrum]|uniref:SEA domain-containing protein n=1 Tax=Danionella cerebrum TaxID=2873325 RepID=A0A553NJ93_9TELE|nr:hypothetical protein DNTS_021722 [Danionella translucida]